MPIALLATFIYPPLRLADWLMTGFVPPIWLWLVSWGLVVVLMRSAFRDENNWLRAVFVQWLGIGFILFVIMLVAELILLLTQFEPAWLAKMVILTAFVTCLIGVIFSNHIRIRNVEIKSPLLDKPIRLVQISDVHIGSRSVKFLSIIVDKINAIKPDFVVITGDLVDASSVDRAALSALASLDCRCFFAIGNHDRWVDLDRLLADVESHRVEVLRNRHTSVMGIEIIGIDDADDPGQVAKHLPGIPFDASKFCLLLYHRPLGWEDAIEHNIDLKLSGHTHNGQIFPFNLLVRQMFPRIQGLYQKGQHSLYVSPGTGTWGPTMRIGSINEITCFDLSNPSAGE